MHLSNIAILFAIFAAIWWTRTIWDLFISIGENSANDATTQGNVNFATEDMMQDYHGEWFAHCSNIYQSFHLSPSLIRLFLFSSRI